MAQRLLRWDGWKTLGLLVLSVLFLTLAFAPCYQFYLAWIGLVPFLLAVRRCRSSTTAFLWAWLGGTLFFTANMWWMADISVLGMLALMIFCGVHWGLVVLLIRWGKLFDAPALVAVPAIAAVWTAGEFLRTQFFTNLPWLFIGHTQTPILCMCQIADTLGVYGVTFWVLMVNVLVALALITPKARRKSLIPAAALVLATVAFVCGYGLWRINQTKTTPGPAVLVVQSNYHQDNGTGSKGADTDEAMKFHLDSTQSGINKAGPGNVDLAVWSETTVQWPINSQAVRQYTIVTPRPAGAEILRTRDELSQLASSNHVALLVGGVFWDKFAMQQRDGDMLPLPTEKRNTAFFFNRNGTLGEGFGQRYDKIHLVPFGEFIPFKGTPLYKLVLALGPNYYDEYQLADGSDNGLTVFNLPKTPNGAAGASSPASWRFVTPICFEDIDSRLCAAMFRPGPDGRKRADFLVNITNDGWFAAGENVQHFQAAVFRCIENRAPMARSVNQGVSGFIDSVGRSSGLLAARTEGTSLMRLNLDDRLTIYTQYGDLFAWLCAAGAVAAAGAPAVGRLFKGTKHV
ncbi:MAG: apolipoprotein N-acyltransferase [Tepidisphaeraceae bacterium]